MARFRAARVEELGAMTPAFAQVAGNPGDLHTQTLYMQQYKALHGYTARAARARQDDDELRSGPRLQHQPGAFRLHRRLPAFPFPLICRLARRSREGRLSIRRSIVER
jgi:hypothetical protein